MAQEFEVGKAPWETEQSSEFEVGKAPWETEDQDKIVNEMPEGLEGRFVFKNFGGDPEASFNYLQKVNPNFEIKKDKSGEIIARKRGDKVWGRLDPKGFDIRDPLDVVSDIIAGVGQGLATSAGALAGAAGSPYALGAGAIPAAMATSAASGTALEAARQGIGSYFIDDNMDPESLKWTAGVSALMPTAFGGGITAKAATEAARKTSKEGAIKLAQDYIKRNRGAFGLLWDEAVSPIAKRTASVFGGYPKEMLSKAYEKLDFIKDTEKDPSLGVDYLSKNKDALVNATKSTAKSVGKELENTMDEIDKLGVQIETKKILNPLLNRKKELEGFRQSTDRDEAIKEIDAIINDYIKTEKPKAAQTPYEKLDEMLFGAKTQKELPEFTSTKDAERIRQRLKDYASESGLKINQASTAKGANQAKTATDKQLLNSLYETSENISKQIDDSLDQLGPELKDTRDALRSSYRSNKLIQEEIQKASMSEEAFKNFLKKPGFGPEAARQRVTRETGVDLANLSDELGAVDMFRNPRWQIPSFGGSNTGRTLAAAGAVGAGSALASEGSASDRALTGVGAGLLGMLTMSPAGIRQIMSANKAVRNFPTNPKSGAKFYPYLMMNPELHDQGDQ